MKIYTAAELRILRKSLGLNQDEFWLHFGVLQSGGSRYESGREVPMPVQILLNVVFGEEPDTLTRLRAAFKR